MTQTKDKGPQHKANQQATGPDQQNADGRSRLWLAAALGQLPAVLSQLSTGACVDMQDDDGRSPLAAACYEGHVEVIRALLSAGARIDLQDKGGCSPLYRACAGGEEEAVRALLSAGAQAHLRDKDGHSPLHEACRVGNEHVVCDLVSAGAQADLQDKDGSTPLQIACGNGYLEIVRTLLSAGAQTDLQDKEGRSPLHEACMQCMRVCGMTVVRALLFAGARADLKDSFGRMPLDVTPAPQCHELQRLVCMTRRCRRARGLANAGGGDDGGARASVVLPAPLAHGKAGDNLVSRRDAAEGSPGGHAAGGGAAVGMGSSQPQPARLRKCSMCGPPPAPKYRCAAGAAVAGPSTAVHRGARCGTGSCEGAGRSRGRSEACPRGGLGRPWPRMVRIQDPQSYYNVEPGSWILNRVWVHVPTGCGGSSSSCSLDPCAWDHRRYIWYCKACTDGTYGTVQHASLVHTVPYSSGVVKKVHLLDIFFGGSRALGL